MVDDKRGKINKTLRFLQKQLQTVEQSDQNEIDNENVLEAAKTLSVRTTVFKYQKND